MELAKDPEGNSTELRKMVDQAAEQQEVDSILNMQDTTTRQLIVGYTPTVYRQLGMPSLPLTIGSGHVYSAAKTEAEAKQDGNYKRGTHYHGLGDAALKNIYKAIQDPVMVIAAKDVNKNVSPLRSTHSVVAIVDIGTAKKSLLVPIEITAERTVNGTQMDVNTISSVYERNVGNLVKEAIALENSGDVGVYYAKKEAMTLPVAGVRFPAQLQQSIASNGIIHRFSEKVNMNISENVQRWKAKINAGADGNVFELVENAQYDGGQAEQGKALASHNGVRYWDYFVKDVQIDGSVFNLLANVRQKEDGAFVCSIQLNEDKKRTASPPLGPRRASNGVTNTVEDTITQKEQNVKQKYSRELDSEYMELAKDPEGNSTELTVEQMAYDVMARAAGLNRQKATKADQAVERATEELNRLLKADAGAGADRAEPADHLPAADQERQREIPADAAAARQGSDPARACQPGGGGKKFLRAVQRLGNAAGGPVAADALLLLA